MRRPTPEDRKRWRRNDEFSRFAHENMWRLIEEHAAKEREREERARVGFWGRLSRAGRAA